MTKTQIKRFFAILAQKNPKPKSELNSVSDYTFLVAVVLSAQTTDKGVNKATDVLFKKVRTPQDMLRLGEEKLIKNIRSIGLFRTKAKNIMRFSKILAQKKGFPKTREELEALPGVGRKSANVILNTLFGQPTLAVDTHVFRVANRTGLARGKTPLAVETILEQKIPEKFKLHAHHWLVLLGRYVCKARAPLCSQCLVVKQCRFGEKIL